MLKARFDTRRFSVKLGILFSRLGISPNTWTLMALLPAFIGFVALAFYRMLPESLLLFVVSGFLDAVDGAVARVTRSVSALGAFLDGIIDRYVEFLLYMGLLFYLFNVEEQLWLPNPFWVAFLIFGSLMPSYIRAYADHRKVVTEEVPQRSMGGLLERAERLVLVYLGMLIGIYDVILLVYVVAATAVLANYTALQRLWFVVNYGKRR
ncbi:MAG: CDP-alcohol phosphatidyltransferase family protein [Candidatus Altiarchaeota archaeon]|nr:CDP-alcohol phosphatidyltransferase family protein [Candidatus Altiarchaeota archaeon]